MPTHPFHTLDAVVVVVYLGITFIVGVLAHRFWRSSPASDEEYYLAGRRVPAWVNGISYAATAINADVAPLYCGLAAVIGLPVAWYYLSRFSLAWLIVAMLFAARWRQLGIRTGPEFYALRFGGRGARFVRVYTALFTVAINIIPWIGAGLLGTHKILAPVMGYELKDRTLLFVAPLVAIYVWVSGYAGVLATDVFQAFVIIAASLVLMVEVVVVAGGPTGLTQQILSAHPQEYSEILSATPVRGHEIMGPLLVLAWLVIPTIGRGGSVDVDGQRILSCPTPREAAKVTIWGQVAMFAILLLMTLPVLGILARHPELYHASRGQREQVYGIMLAEYLPHGLLGLALAGVLASVMSTISGLLSYGSQTLVNDVLRQVFVNSRALDPERASSVWIGRIVVLVVLALGVCVMYSTDSLFGIAVFISGMFGASAAFYWAQWWWWRINLWSWVAAMVGGPTVYIILGRLLPHWPWWQAQLAANEANIDAMTMFQAIMAMSLTTCLWVIVTLVTPPEDSDTLERFYTTARPMGAWAPVRRRIIEAGRPVPNLPSGLFLGGLATAILGTVSIAATILGLSQLYVGAYLLAATLLIVAIVGGLVFRTAFNWHMHRLEAD
ncbi:MAG: hypothetical protein U0805_18070 [Pirellulales bacterium]